MTRRLDRRRFLHESAGLAAALAASGGLHPRLAGAEDRKPPSERLNIGVVGVAGQGDYDLHNVTSENIYALCDVDEDRAAKVRGEFPRAKFFKDFRRLLDLKEIDAVVCATPRRACRASMTARISGGAWRTASSIAFSSFTMRSVT